MSKRMLTAGKIFTDHLTGQRVLQQTTYLGDDESGTFYARSRRNTTGPMMRLAANRQLLASRILRSPVL